MVPPSPSAPPSPAGPAIAATGPPVVAGVPPAAVSLGDTTGAVGRTRLPLGFWLACTWLVALVALAVLAPVLPFLQDPNAIDPAALRAGPSTAHWFGADDGGRDLFARVIYGGRVSLFIGVAAITIGLLAGGFLGVTAGYFRGRYGQLVMASMDALLAFPALVLALALVAFLSDPGQQGGDVTIVTTVLGVLSVPALARLARAGTLRYTEREFVLAARGLGARHRRILVREILPNVIPPLLSLALLGVAVVIVAEGALSFLGLSVKAPQPTWGNLIAQGRPVIQEAPHMTLIPSGVMFATLLAINYAGDVLSQRFRIREALL